MSKLSDDMKPGKTYSIFRQSWLQSSWKLSEAYIREMGVNKKFDFRRDWKFCWNLSNIISGGTVFFQVELGTLRELW